MLLKTVVFVHTLDHSIFYVCHRTFRMLDSDHHASVLIDAIDRFLRGEIGVDECRESFYDYYVDVVPEHALSEREHAFFGETWRDALGFHSSTAKHAHRGDRVS